MGASRAAAHPRGRAGSLAALVPWLSFVDTSLGNGRLSVARLGLRKLAQVGVESWSVVGFVATQKPPRGMEGSGGGGVALAGNAIGPCVRL